MTAVCIGEAMAARLAAFPARYRGPLLQAEGLPIGVQVNDPPSVGRKAWPGRLRRHSFGGLPRGALTRGLVGYSGLDVGP
jgi:hypothetical protein